MPRRISLDGEWQFQQVGTNTWKAGTVPGCVQLDLLKLGEVSDPFYRMNEIEMYGLEDKGWIYLKTFTLSAEDMGASWLELVFEGIDTYADIYLNDIHLDWAEDMFIAHSYDISEIAREGENTLTVHFLSAVSEIKLLEQNSPLSLRSSCETARPYIRKAQYAYGWDWGPRIVQVGLWRPVYIEVVREARLSNPFVWTDALSEGTARVRVHADAEGDFDEQTELTARITLALNGVQAATAEAPVSQIRGVPAVEATLEVANPQLWWPNGLGEHPLYDVTITLRDGDRALDECQCRAGLRTVRLIQESDVEGRSFIVEINGVRVFAKGANWIPADSMLPRLTREDYQEYIRLAQEAQMNMLRIWGGGIYEDPAFFDACDERGIMVWQDFTFACAQYPDEFAWFQDLARHEAEQVVLALRNHPSLVLWCGNNENNWGFDEWWGDGVPQYLGNYVYREILPEVVGQLDPSRPYWVSSPYGGEHPNGSEEGDRHAWGVWSNWQDYKGYLTDTGRFLSEFGFQAMPNWKTVLSYTAPEDRSILSPVMISHNKMTEGMERLTRFLVGRIGFPKDLQSFVYLTQFNQAEAIRTGVEHWRLRKFMTAGALYWQINDCWPVASWSCLDYYKRKKALYYATQRFFAPLLPVLKAEEDGVTLYGVNDWTREVQGVARVAAYRLTGEKTADFRFPVMLLANDVNKLKKFSPQDLGLGFTPRVVPTDNVGTTNPHEVNGEWLDTVLFVELTVDGQTFRNYAVFDRFRSLRLEPAVIHTAFDGHRITLTSAVPAFGVFIEPGNDVDLSDNGLILEPNVPYVVECSGAPGEIQVFSLVDMVAKV